MLKFKEIFIKGMPKYDEYKNIPDEYSIMKEWQSFYDECQKYIAKTKNRKPIVDFKVRKVE